MDEALFFYAGTVAEQLGWTSSGTITTVDSLEKETPSGGPLLLMAPVSELSLEVMRTIAAFHGAGREVALVCDTTLPESLASWLPATLIHPASEKKPSVGPVGAFLPRSDVWDEWFSEMHEGIGIEGDRQELAALLETTRIRANLDVEWWMGGTIRVHEGAPPRAGEEGWDYRSDVVTEIGGLVAVPFIVGDYCRALGVAGIRGQHADEGAFIITGTWQKADTYPRQHERGHQEPISASAVELLLNTYQPQQPTPYPSEVTRTQGGEATFDLFAEMLMLNVLDGVLHTGVTGFRRFLPHFNEWVKGAQ